MTGGVLLCLAPIVVAAADFAPALLPLFLCPLMAIYRAGREAARSEHAANHDSLTGLANRVNFNGAVQRAVGGERLSILLMDLNRFKEVNDTLGHHYGDLLLQEIADRLRVACEDAEAIARLGGDEFAVLVTGMAPYEDATAVAQRIAESFEQPFELADFVVEAEASIGIALYPDDGADVDTLLQRADVAMYRAKETHKHFARYDEEHDHHSPARLALMGDLRNAIDTGQIVLWYQPAIDLSTGTVGSVEALVRWEHPELGLLAPGAFIDMAERTSLIKPLTTKVLSTAMAQAKQWDKAGMPLTVAVNISMRSLLDRDFAQHVRGLLEEAAVDARFIKLEITESTIMADPDVVRSVLDDLSAIGLRLSIDDFGTGYSSLAYLKDLPVNEVKIDRSFVSGMAEGSRDAVIVRSTIDLGHHLGLQVVAEGVEDAPTLERLAELGCDLAQGYGISRPLPAPKLTEWLHRADPDDDLLDVVSVLSRVGATA
jgi:diguanylate cyclase (GGDEF)-like protein